MLSKKIIFSVVVALQWVIAIPAHSADETYCPSVARVDTPYVEALKNNPFRQAENRLQKSASGEIDPVKISEPMSRFRDHYLGFLKGKTHREPLVQSFEHSLRMQSDLVEAALSKLGGVGEFDFVVPGTGPHSLTLVLQLLKLNPDYHILFVDENDTAAATFRYAREGYKVNSSNKRSGEDTRPVPGEGNINELPGAPIQVSDLTNAKYPSANDLGVANVASLYAIFREYPNVHVLFGSKITDLTTNSQSKTFIETAKVESHKGAKYTLHAQYIAGSTGVGDTKLPESLVSSLKANPELTKFLNGKLARVVVPQDYFQFLATQNNPIATFANENISVAGVGDSAYTVIEFPLGFAPQEAYAMSSAQSGRINKISWIGQVKKTCAEFIQTIRSRYQDVSTGFQSSSANVSPVIEAFSSQLASVRANGVDRVDAILVDGTVIPNQKSIVLSTGYSSNVRSLFGSFLRSKNQSYSTDLDFFNQEFDTIQAPTALTPGQQVPVARKLKGRNVALIGVAADLAPKGATPPAGIVQNFLGLFYNAPRVVAAAKVISKDIQPKAPGLQLQTLELGPEPTAKKFIIEDLHSARILEETTEPLLLATWQQALSYVHTKANGLWSIDLMLSKDGHLVVSSSSPGDITEVLKLLAATREFYNLSYQILMTKPHGVFHFSARANHSVFDPSTAKLSFTTEDKDLDVKSAVRIKNTRIKYRGIQLQTSTSRSIEETKTGNGVTEPTVEALPKSLSELKNNLILPKEPLLLELADDYKLISNGLGNVEIVSKSLARMGAGRAIKTLVAPRENSKSVTVLDTFQLPLTSIYNSIRKQYLGFYPSIPLFEKGRFEISRLNREIFAITDSLKERIQKEGPMFVNIGNVSLKFFFTERSGGNIALDTYIDNAFLGGFDDIEYFYLFPPEAGQKKVIDFYNRAGDHYTLTETEAGSNKFLNFTQEGGNFNENRQPPSDRNTDQSQNSEGKNPKSIVSSENSKDKTTTDLFSYESFLEFSKKGGTIPEDGLVNYDILGDNKFVSDKGVVTLVPPTNKSFVAKRKIEEIRRILRPIPSSRSIGLEKRKGGYVVSLYDPATETYSPFYPLEVLSFFLNRDGLVSTEIITSSDPLGTVRKFKVGNLQIIFKLTDTSNRTVDFSVSPDPDSRQIRPFDSFSIQDAEFFGFTGEKFQDRRIFDIFTRAGDRWSALEIRPGSDTFDVPTLQPKSPTVVGVLGSGDLLANLDSSGKPAVNQKPSLMNSRNTGNFLPNAPNTLAPFYKWGFTDEPEYYQTFSIYEQGKGFERIFFVPRNIKNVIRPEKPTLSLTVQNSTGNRFVSLYNPKFKTFEKFEPLTEVFEARPDISYGQIFKINPSFLGKVFSIKNANFDIVGTANGRFRVRVDSSTISENNGILIEDVEFIQFYKANVSTDSDSILIITRQGDRFLMGSNKNQTNPRFLPPEKIH